MAIGAQIASPDSKVVCLCGDGGFAHSWAELETLRRMELPITTLVLNNGILGYQKHAEEVKFGEHTKAVNFTGWTMPPSPAPAGSRDSASSTANGSARR